jgi:hypothetical protein
MWIANSSLVMNLDVNLLSEEFGIKYIGFPSFAFFVVSILLVPVFPYVSLGLFFIGVGYVVAMGGFILILLSRYHVR